MNASAKSVFYFGIYLLPLGALLLFIPNPFLTLFGFPPTEGIWIHVLGVVVIALGGYYIGSARHNLTPFFRMTVFARTFVFIAFLLFVIFLNARPMLALFGTVDLLGALWTWLTLRSS